MLVRTQSKGREFTGVEVGASNVRRYFPRQIQTVDLEIDHLQIQCGLKPGFWSGHPEISDPRLCAWLEAKNFHGKPGERPIPLAMIPSGKNRFRLQTVEMGSHARNKPVSGPAIPA
ncbi:MAG: hypothetical protein WBE72_24070 [Terracidiphilus sp.]